MLTVGKKRGLCIRALATSLQVHIKVSKTTIEFSNAAACLPEERMRDRLELGFSKPSRGGGEVESVTYDMKTGAGRITFLNTGGLLHATHHSYKCLTSDLQSCDPVTPLEYGLTALNVFRAYSVFK